MLREIYYIYYIFILLKLPINACLFMALLVLGQSHEAVGYDILKRIKIIWGLEMRYH